MRYTVVLDESPDLDDSVALPWAIKGSVTRRTPAAQPHYGKRAMNEKNLAFTAVFLELNGEYIAFIEELPAMNAHGRSISEARKALHELAAEVFDEERRNVDEMLCGKGIFRESMVIPVAG